MSTQGSLHDLRIRRRLREKMDAEAKQAQTATRAEAHA